MKKKVLAIALTAFAMVILFSYNINTAKAQSDYTVEQVNHKVEVMYNGYILINDTIKLNITGQAPNDFLLGFPYKYGSYVLECTASSASGAIQVSLDESLENHVGFYAVKLSFPQGAPQEFTVVFVLSNSLFRQDQYDASLFTLDFPAYPGLTEQVTICKASFVLPSEVTYSSGTVAGPTYETENLQPFTYSPATVTFSVSNNKLQLVNVDQLRREITVNEFGEIGGSDAYVITNLGRTNATVFDFILPPNATKPNAKDQLGRTMETPKQTDASLNRYRVNLTLQVGPRSSTRFTVEYALPSSLLVQSAGNNFALAFPFFQNVDYYIGQASVTFASPEGARILNAPSGLTSGVYGVSRSVFQETASISMQGVTRLDDVNAQIEYWYNPLWLSFRPTIWIWTLAIAGCVVVLVWRRPKGAATVVVPSATSRLRPEVIRSFAGSYEEKMKIGLEMETLETSVQKGRIPRSRYKVRKKMLETRLNTLSGTLEDLRGKIRASGGHYVGLMLQLEVAEAEIDEAATSLKNSEASHNRGELSLEAYRKRVAEFDRRKVNAETTINGILIRLREETR